MDSNIRVHGMVTTGVGSRVEHSLLGSVWAHWAGPARGAVTRRQRGMECAVRLIIAAVV